MYSKSFNKCIFVSDHNVVYACVADMEDNLVRTTDGGFNRDEYFAHPERYASTFSKKVTISSFSICRHLWCNFLAVGNKWTSKINSIIATLFISEFLIQLVSNNLNRGNFIQIWVNGCMSHLLNCCMQISTQKVGWSLSQISEPMAKQCHHHSYFLILSKQTGLLLDVQRNY